jgi:hypothetical protein
MALASTWTFNPQHKTGSVKALAFYFIWLHDTGIKSNVMAVGQVHKNSASTHEHTLRVFCLPTVFAKGL